MALRIQCPAFTPAAPIPAEFTGDGVDCSPPLTFSGVPPRAQQLALIVEDPDAPTPEPWVHWVLYRLPADVTSLPRNIRRSRELQDFHHACQGKNSWNQIGYRGPAPPRGHGVHHYHFMLYALDTKLDLPAGATKAELQHAMAGHVLASDDYIGTYSR
jgi:Raf kinase inhibitor-like YbhB/YbcL family protein